MLDDGHLNHRSMEGSFSSLNFPSRILGPQTGPHHMCTRLDPMKAEIVEGLMVENQVGAWPGPKLRIKSSLSPSLGQRFLTPFKIGV